ncbi:ATP-dependent Clp protease ATP-binding subunit ClpX [Bifidobacterium gallicum]|uniref:ATP-dependent Clp protease, ATP-binding subunit ClpX n=1 Tax=Bifidobacterium gallicum DSM 20093 = LMG 11596 TaxID=561180 RepID=D1NRZ0_9BIFI|nr:ATP-dependent Clp protease ATP-binding subunit ClpX [Bifidobacterium gallicum]EFA23442.1 ATP-dependent Clp protease, ATP-binding subunit ClpX [Bifidobacterium gallicum DSM 20093 = LMG 11596]KFI57266.1 ATPase AAA [Bifidobacterium gallicum DSM 20093 = LMG 11596]
MGRVISYSDGVQHCAFCGKSEHDVQRLVAGAGVAICEECIALCQQIISDERKQEIAQADLAVPTPASINAKLNDTVVGQAAAKRTLSVAVHNHYKRVLMEEREALGAADGSHHHAMPQALVDVRVSKSNILLIGPTGVGKTYLAQTLADAMDVPFIIADATSLTEAGYVGDDVETLLSRLLDAADGDADRACHGIVYIDEIDKIARKSGDNTSLTRDVSGEGVQQALLKLMEGTIVDVPIEHARKGKEAQTVRIDTRNVLFICAGAFVGLNDIVERRLGRHESGFGSALRTAPLDHVTLENAVSADDLADFGLLPEFIGRVPVVSVLKQLDEHDLQAVLTQPRDALTKQYAKLFATDGVDLRFTQDAIEEIAHQAIASHTGARGLRAIMERALESTMFELPSHDDVVAVIVDAPSIRGEHEPQFVYAGQQGPLYAINGGNRAEGAPRSSVRIMPDHDDDTTQAKRKTRVMPYRINLR